MVVLQEVKTVVEQAEELLEVHEDVKLEEEAVCEENRDIPADVLPSFFEAIGECFGLIGALLGHAVGVADAVADKLLDP